MWHKSKFNESDELFLFLFEFCKKSPSRKIKHSFQLTSLNWRRWWPQKLLLAKIWRSHPPWVQAKNREEVFQPEGAWCHWWSLPVLWGRPPGTRSKPSATRWSWHPSPVSRWLHAWCGCNLSPRHSVQPKEEIIKNKLSTLFSGQTSEFPRIWTETFTRLIENLTSDRSSSFDLWKRVMSL